MMITISEKYTESSLSVRLFGKGYVSVAMVIVVNVAIGGCR